MLSMDIAPEIVGEDKTWRFVGIWAKNRWEWTNTLIAGMHYKITTVGFYDAQSEEQVDYIIRQTEMTSVVCTEDYAKRLITMKGKGMVPSIQKVILVTPPSPDLIQSASANQIDVFTYDQVLQAGENMQDAPEYIMPEKNDIYIFSYTSGTTGDPKGVKLSHNNILSSARCSLCRVILHPGETLISYLPYTHSFEQSLFGFALCNQLRIGFYTGDPAAIVSDCQALQPNFFPSVPRLYNRIYQKLQAGISEATGCKRWLADRAVAAK